MGQGELGKDLIAGKKVSYNYLDSSYQWWNAGSSVIFWRWHDKLLARDDIAQYIYNLLSTSQRRARAPGLKVQRSSLTGDKVREKIVDEFVYYIKRSYIKLVPSTNIKSSLTILQWPRLCWIFRLYLTAQDVVLMTPYGLQSLDYQRLLPWLGWCTLGIKW